MTKTGIVSFTFTALLTACGAGDGDTALECDGNGEWMEDHSHCHCDSGYTLTEDGAGCEPDEDDGSDGGDGTSDGDAFNPDSVEATLRTLSDGSQAWVLAAKDGQTWLTIENYPAYGGATGPETRTLDATEADYATCGVCLLLQTDCSPHGDHAHCGTTFMPEPGGEVSFDALGQATGDIWSGALSDVRFVEVDIGNNLDTTPVEDGDSFTISGWSFEVELNEE